MKLPNVWGQGSIFTFSGLDGECDLQKSITATLLGDNLGVRLQGDTQYDLYISVEEIADIQYEIVASDIILAQLQDRAGKTYETSFVFLNQNSIIGKCRVGTVHFRAVTEVPYTVRQSVMQGSTVSVKTYVYHAGERYLYFFSMEQDEYTYFAISTRKNISVTEELLEHTVADRMNFYGSLPKLAFSREEVERAFYKSISIMKSQVYSSQGIFQQNWTTPDKVPHRLLWLWDSVFHSLGNWLLDEKLSRDSILSVLDTQQENGFVPHKAAPDMVSSKAQPPVLAYGMMKLYEREQDIELLKQVYPRLEAYLQWHMEHRRDPENGLFVWHINRTSVDNRCDESGMDNSPRFDDVAEMDCIDFSCFMVVEAEVMALISQIIENHQAAYWQQFAAALKDSINAVLWDEEEQFYYDRIIENQQFHKVKSIASFLPLFAGVCGKRQAEKLTEELLNPCTFGALCGIPSISKEDAAYGTDMWRGPVWMNYNYLIIQGLERYGYAQLAQTLAQRIIQTVTDAYVSDGVFYEFYSADGTVSSNHIMRKGPVVKPYNYHVKYQSIRDFGWTASLFAALVLDYNGK